MGSEEVRDKSKRQEINEVVNYRYGYIEIYCVKGLSL